MNRTALVALGRWLQDAGYRFTTVTPATHARVLARECPPRVTLADVFGWSRCFTERDMPPTLFARMVDAGILAAQAADAPLKGGPRYTSRVRFASLGGDLFCHSAFPTNAADAVFFGPDTYRFARLIASNLGGLTQGAQRIVDVGCGSGAGGIVAVRQLAAAGAVHQLLLGDINRAALEMASVNAELAGLAAEVAVSDVLAGVAGACDIILANPPYLVDADARAYRHGGGSHGTELAQRIVAESLPRLAPGGRLILYTGSPVIDGADVFLDGVRQTLGTDLPWHYAEIDPDVFGEELDCPAYRAVERIAAVGLVVTRPLEA